MFGCFCVAPQIESLRAVYEEGLLLGDGEGGWGGMEGGEKEEGGGLAEAKRMVQMGLTEGQVKIATVNPPHIIADPA